MSQQFRVSSNGERYLQEVNRQLFANHPARSVFDAQLDIDVSLENTLFIIVGTDSGLLLSYLADQLPGKGSYIIFVEADEYHDFIQTSCQPRWDPERYTLCPVSELRGQLSEERLLTYSSRASILVLESLGCRTDYPGCYFNVLRKVKSTLDELLHRLHARINTRMFVEAQLRNSTENRLPAARLRGAGENRTAMILGAGPSLDNEIQWVIENRHRLVIFAVSRLCEKLDQIGLRPDVVVAVDPQAGLTDISKHGLLWQDTLLVSAYHVAPSLLQQWQGPCMYLGDPLAWSVSAINRPDSYAADNVDVAGSTVSHSAIWLAHQWGFAKILMAGVDLCYAPGGGTHTQGTAEARIGSLPFNYAAQVCTYSGRVAGTSMPMKHSIGELSDFGSVINEKHTCLINLCANSAAVETIPCIGTQEIDLCGLDKPFSTVVEGISVAAHIEWLKSEVISARLQLVRIQQYCDKAVNCLDGLHGRKGRAPDYRFKHKLDVIERKMETTHAQMFLLVKHCAILQLNSIMKPSGFTDMKDAELESWGRSYYRIIKAAAKWLVSQIDSARERADMRLLESAKPLDAKRLLAYWEKDGTRGRVMLLRNQLLHSADPDTVMMINEAANAFTRDLNENDTGFSRSLDEQKLDLSNITRTLTYLFNEENKTDLEVLVGSLAELEAPYPVLSRYACGLLEELSEKMDSALCCYQEVVDYLCQRLNADESLENGLARLLEDTLLRINHIYLVSGDGQSAVDTLAVLSQVSPAYAPRYAELLDLLGRNQEAIDVLQHHIEAHPGDWLVVRQLADVYAGCDAVEAAAMANELAARLQAESASAQHGAVERIWML